MNCECPSAPRKQENVDPVPLFWGTEFCQQVKWAGKWFPARAPIKECKLPTPYSHPVGPSRAIRNEYRIKCAQLISLMMLGSGRKKKKSELRKVVQKWVTGGPHFCLWSLSYSWGTPASSDPDFLKRCLCSKNTATCGAYTLLPENQRVDLMLKGLDMWVQNLLAHTQIFLRIPCLRE